MPFLSGGGHTRLGRRRWYPLPEVVSTKKFIPVPSSELEMSYATLAGPRKPTSGTAYASCGLCNIVMFCRVPTEASLVGLSGESTGTCRPEASQAYASCVGDCASVSPLNLVRLCPSLGGGVARVEVGAGL